MRLAYDVYHSPGGVDVNKSPVIMLHGRLYNRKTWKRFAIEVAEKTGRKVFAVDARNHGDSPWSDDMDFDILTDDLEEFMGQHDIPRAVLVGHSMGGRTAISLALRKPEKVEKLFIEDMAVNSYTTKTRGTVGQVITLMRMALKAIPAGADLAAAKKAVYDYMRSFIPPGSTSGFMCEAEDLSLKICGNGYVWAANLDVLEDMLKNRSPQVHSLTGVYHGEALFLYGGKSFIGVEKDESIPNYFPRAVMVCIEDAGHLIHQDYPDVFSKELLKFIS